METKQIIEQQPLGSIERLFLIFLYKDGIIKESAFKCINKRLRKMRFDLRITACKKLISIYSINCFKGNVVECTHYFNNGKMLLK